MGRDELRPEILLRARSIICARLRARKFTSRTKHHLRTEAWGVTSCAQKFYFAHEASFRMEAWLLTARRPLSRRIYFGYEALLHTLSVLPARNNASRAKYRFARSRDDRDCDRRDDAGQSNRRETTANHHALR